MKKAIVAAIAALLASPSFAQFNGDGFYRIKNKGAAQRYISIVNDRVDDTNKNVDVTSASSFIDIQVYALGTVKDPVCDPGSILYLTGKEIVSDSQTKSIQVSIQSQGMNTDKLTKDQKLQIVNDTYLFAEYKGVALYLSDTYESYLTNRDMNACIISGKTRRNSALDYAEWDVIKVDNTNEYLGVKPEISVDGKYYTTLYTSFAYQLSDGMKAYYIDQHKSLNIAEPVAEWKEIVKMVPAATPVIIECSSNKPEDNKIFPVVDETLGTIAGNELTGNYFCYIKLKTDGTENEEPKLGAQLKNVVAYDANTIRVLGTVDGKLALVPAADDQLVITNKGKYLPANKAYFTIPASEATATQKGILILSPADYEVAITGIQDAVRDQSAANQPVFTLEGVHVGNTTEGLQKGIYIVGGKKVIVR